MATLKYKTPDGGWKKVSIGGGGSTEEVYVGSDAPTDENVKVWINPTGTSSGGGSSSGGGTSSGSGDGGLVVYVDILDVKSAYDGGEYPAFNEWVDTVMLPHNIEIYNQLAEAATNHTLSPAVAVDIYTTITRLYTDIYEYDIPFAGSVPAHAEMGTEGLLLYLYTMDDETIFELSSDGWTTVIARPTKLYYSTDGTSLTTEQKAENKIVWKETSYSKNHKLNTLKYNRVTSSGTTDEVGIGITATAYDTFIILDGTTFYKLIVHSDGSVSTTKIGSLTV